MVNLWRKLLMWIGRISQYIGDIAFLTLLSLLGVTGDRIVNSKFISIT